ncbi:MAG: GNAT family N-acetyltransferase [Oscillospiraceae bacterium]|nr:GNAT family N-acetyltransferase [Oscillospiraceae bacterium]
MDIHIRKARPEDAHPYAANHVACWQAAYQGILPDEYLNAMPVEKMAERNRQTLSDPGLCRYYCVEQDGRMIGRLITCESCDEDKSNAGEIAAIYLLDAFWGKGYGRKLMDFALADLTSQGYDEAILWVLEPNHRARRFYEKCGFALDGAQKEIHIGQPHTELRYTLALSK